MDPYDYYSFRVGPLYGVCDILHPLHPTHQGVNTPTSITTSDEMTFDGVGGTI